jgi:heme/copper-type cytochrome/quinol oxidase subunit 3
VAEAAALPPRVDDAPPDDGRSGAVVRLGLLIFALAFQILTFLGLFVFLHVLRGNYEGSTYSTAQQVDAAVVGLPGAALAIGALLIAIWNLFSGRRSRLVLHACLAAVVLMAVAFLLELALK